MTHIATCSHCLRVVVSKIGRHRQLFERVPCYRVVRQRGADFMGEVIEYCFSPVGPNHYKRIEDKEPE